MSDLVHQLNEQIASLQQLSNDDPNALLELYQKLSDAYKEQNKFGKAAEQLEASILLLEAQDTDTVFRRADLLHELALLYSNNLDAEQAMDSAQKSLELFADIEAESEYAKVYRRLGALYAENNYVQEGMECLEAGIHWGKHSQNPKITGDTYQTLAEVYNYLQKYQEASNAYRNAIQQFQSIPDYKQVAAMHQAIGRILVQHGKHEKGIEQYELASENLQKDSDSAEYLGINHLVIARIFESKSNTPKAIQNYHIAATHFEQSNNIFEQVNALIQIAALYESEKQWQNALETYQNAANPAEIAAHELPIATVSEGIKHCQKMIDKQKSNTNAQELKQEESIFGKIKKIWGNK